MRKVCLFLGLALFASADVYDDKNKVQYGSYIYITKKRDNLYTTSPENINTKIYIETELCKEEAVNTKARLRSSGSSLNNELVFENGKTCRVSGIMMP
jgi:hypothetical protein